MICFSHVYVGIIGSFVTPFAGSKLAKCSFVTFSAVLLKMAVHFCLTLWTFYACFSQITITHMIVQESRSVAAVVQLKSASSASWSMSANLLHVSVNL